MESTESKILNYMCQAFKVQPSTVERPLNNEERRFANIMVNMLRSFSIGSEDIEWDTEEVFDYDSMDEDSPNFGMDFSDCEIGSVTSSCFGEESEDESLFEENQMKRAIEAVGERFEDEDDELNISDRERRLKQRREIAVEGSASLKATDSNYQPDEEPARTSIRIFDRFTKEQIDKIYEYYTTKAKKRKASTTIKHFQSIKLDYNGLNAIKKYKEEGNDFEKYLQVDELAFEMFKSDREQAMIVRKPHLFSYLRIASNQFKPKKTCMSDSYIRAFCKRHNIGSKKVTRVVNKTGVVDEGKDFEIANAFVEDTRRYLEENGKYHFI